eukprot:gene9041-biopygen3685
MGGGKWWWCEAAGWATADTPMMVALCTTNRCRGSGHRRLYSAVRVSCRRRGVVSLGRRNPGVSPLTGAAIPTASTPRGLITVSTRVGRFCVSRGLRTTYL